MPAVDVFNHITTPERDFGSPTSEDLWKKVVEQLEALQDLVATNGLGILKGAADADPPNAEPSYITDADPTVGEINKTDKFKNLTLKITSGMASGKTFVITGTDATNKRVNVAENLFSEGVRSGDTYQVKGHTHNGVDSESTTPVGTVIKSMAVSAPAGFLAIGQAVSRTTYADLYNVSTFQQVGSTTNGSAVVTGLVSTADMWAGMKLEGTGIPAGTTILSVDSGTQITISANATATGTPTLRFFPFGNGDGSTTFDLPEPGRVDVATGQGSGLTLRKIGQKFGTETHTLTTGEIPPHGHQERVGDASVPTNLHDATYAQAGTGGNAKVPAFQAGLGNHSTDTPAVTTKDTGGGGAHNNVQPSVGLRWYVKY